MRDSLSIKLNVTIRGIDVHTGKEVYRHEGKNIFLDTGRTWLAQALAYDTTGYIVEDPALLPDPEPVVPGPPPPLLYYRREVTHGLGSPTTADLHMPYLPFYIGLGVGGNQNSGPIPADVHGDYPGGNIQSDADPTVTGMERPVRIRTNVGVAPVRWLQPVLVSLPLATPYNYVQYTATFSALFDINEGHLAPPAGAPYPVVPISEAGLYQWTDNPDHMKTSYALVTDLPFVSGQALAYETFPPLFKTISVAIIAKWQLIFD